MKNKIFKSIVFLSLGLVFFASCKKKIDDAYLTPNAPFAPAIETILPGVIGGFTFFTASAGSGFGVITDGTFIGRYIQYISSTTADSYGMMGYIPPSGPDNTGALWGTFYFGHGGNVNKIIELGTQQEKWDYVGVAWAIRAWGLLELTNEYSDGPLKEAFNPNLSQFHYDSQPEFYDSCRVVCHRALSFLNRTDGNVSKANLAIGDAFFYQGDVNKWKKFVYGVLARSFINLSSKDIFKANNYAFADSAIKYAGLSITANDDNASVKVSGGGTSALNNYWGPFRSNIGGFRQGAYIADLMSGNNTTAFNKVVDPRRWYILSENLNGTFKGFYPYLGSSGFAANDYPKNFWRNPVPTSQTPPTVDSTRYLYQDKSPWPMMTASEMQFIIAEAGLRKGDAASRDIALAAYKNAIKLNFEMLTSTYNQNIPAGKDLSITANSADVFLSNTAVVPASSANLTLTQVMLQKYIALYIWGCQQTWVDMRKFHYVDVDPATSKQVYADFTPPTGTNLVSTNNGKLVYRFRPRFNSEFLYDIPELTRIGAYQNLDYGTYEMWFSMK